MIIVQSALAGALTGGLYALMAIGLSLGWGMLKVINLAHFGMILLGGYLTYTLVTSTGLDPLLTVVVTAPILFVVGAALQWLFQRFDVSELSSLLVSFGILIIVIQLISNVWSADFRRLTRRPESVRDRISGARSARLSDADTDRVDHGSGAWCSASISCCSARSSVVPCAHSLRTGPSPRPSASTIGASASCSPGPPPRRPRSPACSSPSADR